MLAILYWVILVLCIIGILAPPKWVYGPRISGAATVALFIFIGLKIFKVPL